MTVGEERLPAAGVFFLGVYVRGLLPAISLYLIMTQPPKYTCTICGKEHEEWPALAYISPSYYHALSDEEKSMYGELDADFCIIRHPEQTDRFIRGSLTQQVTDHCESLEYGVWVSLSETSFLDYRANFDNENHEVTYFGWLSNDLPDYEFKNSIPVNVNTRTGNQRPEIVPHSSFEHPFVNDYYNGITKAEAEQRIQAMLQQGGEK